MPFLNRENIKLQAKSFIQEPFIGALMGMIGIFLGINFVGSFFFGGLASIFCMFLSMNIIRTCFERRMMNKVPAVGDLFDFRESWKLIKVSLWRMYYTLPFLIMTVIGFFLFFVSAIILVASAESETGGGMVFAVLLAILSWLMIIAGVVLQSIFNLKYFCAPYIALDDPQITAKDAVITSAKFSKGRLWEIIVLELSFMGWNLLNGLTLNILSIWLLPYYYQTQIGYFLELREIYMKQQGMQAPPQPIVQQPNFYQNQQFNQYQAQTPYTQNFNQQSQQTYNQNIDR
jgi:uncharacterized membrane protein